MANWCQHWLSFQGEESKIKEVVAMFQAMEQKGKETNEGQKPDFIQEVKQDYFFDIYTDESEIVSYNTKWSPNLEDIIEIANHLDLNFECTYQELGENIFGKAVFTAGNSEAKIYDLESSDFDLYSFNQDKDIYSYQGEESESEEDILMQIFKEKFNQDY